jgi:GTP cyclohydrolase I
MMTTERHLTTEQQKKIEDAVRDILVALGDDPERAGLQETPKRVAKMYDEVFEGMRYTNDEIAAMFDKCFEEPEAKDLVLMKDIDAFSYCEHHLALMYNMKISVAYIPDGRVIGLSKIARIVDMVCKRLQLQERIATDIADIMQKILRTHDVMVVIEGEHSCMTARGIKKPGTVTNSAVVRGLFKESSTLRAEVYSLLNR